MCGLNLALGMGMKSDGKTKEDLVKFVLYTIKVATTTRKTHQLIATLLKKLI